MSHAVAHAKTVPGLLERAALRAPHRVALVDERERTSCTYAELLTQVRAVASALIDLGVEPCARVALWAPNSADWVVSSLGILFAGAAVVPLSTRWRIGEVADAVERARCAAWIVEDEFLGVAMGAAARAAWRHGPVTSPQALRARAPLSTALVDARLRGLAPDDVSHVQFTSGTTGRPKGAQLRHVGMVLTTEQWVRVVTLGPRDRYPVVSPMSHLGGAKTGTLAAICAGATSLPVATFDADRLLDLIDAEGVTFLQGPPTVFQALLDRADARARVPTSVRVAVTGAAMIPARLLRRLRDTFGLESVHAGYGLTEATGVCTITRRDDPIELVTESSGRPIPGVELRIVGDDGAPLAPGERGEIQVRGVGTMAGYLDDPVATRAAIDDDGWLATGDVGWVDDAGNVRIVDRRTDMIIVGGLNVYPAEIERVLLDHPIVSQVAVVGLPDDRLGEVPVAFVVPAPGTTSGPETLLSWAREQLANYKVPRHVWYVEALPMTAVNKVDKRELASLAGKLLDDGRE